MKASELEPDFNAYVELEQAIKIAISEANFNVAVNACRESLKHLESYLLYRKKKKLSPVYPKLLCIKIICDYAPKLFDREIIIDYTACLTGTRALKKNYSDQIVKLERAEYEVEIARQTWWYIANAPKSSLPSLCKQIGNTRFVKSAVSLWHTCGILTGDDDSLDFKTKLDEKMDLMCPKCGLKGIGTKKKLLRVVSCPRCEFRGYFHIVVE